MVRRHGDVDVVVLPPDPSVTPEVPADATTTFTLALGDETGAPVAGAPVLLERSAGGVWQSVGTVVTGADGRASADLVVSRIADDNRVRASYAGDANHPPVVQEGSLPIRLRQAKVTLGGPS